MEETVAVVLVAVILSSEASFDPGCSKVSQFMLDNGEVLMIVTVGFFCGEISIEQIERINFSVSVTCERASETR